MGASRMIIFIVLICYLIGLGFMLPAINNLLDDNNKVLYDNSSRALPQDQTEFTFVTSITSLPLWFNTIFIMIPFIIMIIIGITFFIPTTNAGA